MEKKENKGDSRRRGNPGTLRVEERRERVTLMVLPSVLNPFKKKHGRGWSRRVEEFMKKEVN